MDDEIEKKLKKLTASWFVFPVRVDRDRDYREEGGGDVGWENEVRAETKLNVAVIEGRGDGKCDGRIVGWLDATTSNSARKRMERGERRKKQRATIFALNGNGLKCKVVISVAISRRLEGEAGEER